MEETEKFYIWLSQFGLNNKKFEGVVEVCQSIEQFACAKGLDKIFKFDELEKMKEAASPIRVRTYFEGLEKQNITVLCKFLPNFPKKLKYLPDCPLFLFCKGDLSLLDMPSLSIVGARSPSNYGRIVTSDLAGQIAKKDIVIVSGLAYGVDSLSHKRALEVGGKTIAVLGGGFNHIYPSEHTSLAGEIAQKGLLVSEYPPHAEPTKYTFIERNRIIAGLGDGVLITEASLKSGTRTTKEFAFDYGKNIYAVPGSIKSELSDLPNKLISCGHAKCVTCAEDILCDYNIKNDIEKPPVQVKQLSAQEEILLDLLADGEKDFNFLQENSGFDVKNLKSYLTILEIRGIIKKLPDGSYAAV